MDAEYMPALGSWLGVCGRGPRLRGDPGPAGPRRDDGATLGVGGAGR